jgi:hypothetical protein
MYFYIHKTDKNEQTQLLEMRSDACIRFRNGKGIYGIDQLYKLFFLKVAGQTACATFYFSKLFRNTAKCTAL